MSSIWKDLLYLHGHLLERDLHWQEDAAAISQAEDEQPSLAAPTRSTTPANPGHCQPSCA